MSSLPPPEWVNSREKVEKGNRRNRKYRVAQTNLRRGCFFRRSFTFRRITLNQRKRETSNDHPIPLSFPSEGKKYTRAENIKSRKSNVSQKPFWQFSTWIRPVVCKMYEYCLGIAARMRTTRSSFPFVSVFLLHDTKTSQCFPRSNPTSARAVELNVFEDLRVYDTTRNEGREARKQDDTVESICRNPLKKSTKKRTRLMFLSSEHRWKIVKALAPLCAVVVGQKWRIATNRCFSDHYCVTTKNAKSSQMSQERQSSILKNMPIK